MSGYPNEVLIDVKFCPVNVAGVYPLSSATAYRTTVYSRAWNPLPPGNVKLNGAGYEAWPATFATDAVLTWANRSRQARGPGSVVALQTDSTSDTIEGTLTIEVLIAGVVKRTVTGLTTTTWTYTRVMRVADDSDMAKIVQFRITPKNGTSTGQIRTTPSFVMS